MVRRTGTSWIMGHKMPPRDPNDDDDESLSLGSVLPRTTVRLEIGATVQIVAIGSSSTTGLWMASRAATYPEVMRRELARLRPSARVEVVNSGRIGETISGTHRRFSAMSSPWPGPRGMAARHQ